MNSETSRKIKNRDKPNNIFITPVQLAKNAINMIEYNTNDIWFDPFKNSGNYYNNFPNENKKYTEILENKDFFDFYDPIDIICSNPPYSCLDDVIQKSISLNPRVINYLIGINNLTTKRIEKFNDHGYGLTKLHICKVYKWFGMSIIVQFEKNKDNIISYDRIVWR
jgi:hypothetical protein|tara:strand:+ start:337 stop:834 length:498 start_codon:yes stop_codon:yes gene_type:complete